MSKQSIFTITQLFENQVKNNPQSTALIENNDRLTYDQFNQKVNQLAWFLRQKGVGKESLVVLWLARSIDFMISAYAVLKAGGAYLPMDIDYPAERITYVLKDSQAKFIITPKKLTDQLKEFNGHHFIIEELFTEVANQPTENPPSIIEPHDLAYVIYTSGSTGKPKGVMIEHHSVVNLINGLQQKFPMVKKDVYLFKTNIAFDMSVHEIYAALLNGGRAVILSQDHSRDYAQFAALIAQHRITHLVLVPSVLQAMLDVFTPADINKFQSLRYLFLGGEAVPTLLIEQTKSLLNDKLTIINIYGPTEGTVWQTCCNLKQEPKVANNTIGKPLPHLTAEVLDNDLNPLPVGVAGELYIGGESLARGYLNQPQLTAERFIEHDNKRWYKTGDLCRYLADGNLQYIERIDFQVKIHGFRIEPGEIEARLMTYPGIKKTLVMVQNSPNHQQYLLAYIQCQASQPQPNLSIIKNELADYLPYYMIPDQFVVIEKFPLTSNGKIDRKALPLPILSTSKAYIAPQQATEKLIASIWQEELNLEQVSIDDDFFSLGGNSLLAARVIYTINQYMDKTLEVIDLYRLRTIQQLALLLQGVKLSKGEMVKSFTVEPGEYLMSYAQMSLKNTAPALAEIVVRSLVGEIDVPALKRGFNRLVEQHPVLTAKINWKKPVLYLEDKVRDYSTFLTDYDLRHLTKPQQNKVMDELISQIGTFSAPDSKKRFDESLIFAKLYRLADNDYRLFLITSHLASDGISSNILMQQLYDFYCQELNQKQQPIKPDTSIIQYTYEERDHLNQNLHKYITFWEHYFEDADNYQIKGIDLTKTGVANYPEPYPISPTIMQKMQQLCEKHKIDLAHYLIAVVTTALQPYAPNNQAGIIAMMKALRSDARYKNTVGFLIGSDMLKVRADQAPDLIGLTKQIENDLISSQPYQRCPFSIKFISALKKYWQNKRIAIFLAKLIAKLYCWKNKNLDILPVVIEKVAVYNSLPSVMRNQLTSVTINVTVNFLQSEGTEIFGKKTANINPLIKFMDPANKNFLQIVFDADETGPILSVIGPVDAQLCHQLGDSIVGMLGSVEKPIIH